MKNILCEVCGKKSQMDLTMPLPIGIFRADTCMMCGMELHERFDWVDKILKNRAGLMKIKLPTDLKTAEKVCMTKTAEIKVR